MVTYFVDLESGNCYKIRVQHKDSVDDYWASVGVKFMQPGSKNYPAAAKTVQNWRIEQEN